MNIILTLIAIYIFAPMVLGPFLIKAGHWVSARINITTVEPDTLDPGVKAFLDEARPEFESLGFDFVGYMLLSDYTPGVTSYFALFTDRLSRTSAMAAVIIHKSGKTTLYYEFTNKYTNGRVINVNNSPVAGMYVNPAKSTYRYPKIKSIKQLHDINTWIIAHDRKAVDPVELAEGRELEMLSEAMLNEIRFQEKNGYYLLSEDGSRYKLTWKGAFIMTGKSVFPIKNIRASLDLQAAQKAIAGMPAPAKEPADVRQSGKPITAGAAYRASGRTAAGSGEVGVASRLKLEQQFKNGASWFFWIAALSLVNSVAMKLGSSWHFVIGLGVTQLIDVIALSLQENTNALFQAIILFMDVCFAALFAAFGFAAHKRSKDSFVMGMVFYGLDTFLMLLFFDILGLAFHILALVFLYRGWAALKKLPESPAPQAQPI